jgi:hypothetical protein
MIGRFHFAEDHTPRQAGCIIQRERNIEWDTELDEREAFARFGVPR